MLSKKIRRAVSVLTAMALVLSMCVVSVSALDLVSGNSGTGSGGVKGNIAINSTWTRVHTGANDSKRESVTMTVKEGQSVSGDIGLINGYNFTSTLSGAKFVHCTFKFNATNSVRLRTRKSDKSNYMWLDFSSNGEIHGIDSDTVALGATWNVSEIGGTRLDNIVHIVVNAQTGVGYCYVNGVLAGYSTRLQTDGTWTGFSIYGIGTWEAGDNIQWKYNVDYNVGYTWYKDTEDHTVTIEEVLADKGIAPVSSDRSLFFSNNDIADYLTTANSPDLTYQGKDSVKIEGDYYNQDIGYTQNFVRLFSGNGSTEYNGYMLEKELGGNLIYTSYTQQIDNASRVEMRIRSDSTNQNGHRLSFVPSEDGKTVVSSFSNTETTLDKAWGSPVRVGILIDRSARKAYTLIDGKQLGEAYGYPGTFNDLRLYLNGTEDDFVSSLTLSSWSLKQYDSAKDTDELLAELTGRSVELIYYSFRDASNGLLTDLAGATTVKANAEFRINKDVSKPVDAFLAVYSADGALKDIAKETETLTSSNNTLSLTLNTDALEATDTCKMFFFEAGGLLPIVESITYVKPSEKPIKVLALGNSFSKDSTSTIREIAAADNVNIETYNAYLAGKTLGGHYNAWNDGTEYRIEKEGISTGKYQTLQEFVTMDDWDYIVLQGATHFNCYDSGLWNVDPTATQNYWTTLKNGINALAPKAKRLVHATWAPINELSARVNDGMFADGTPDSRGAYLKALLPNEQIGANIYSTETDENGKKAYIPTAVAIDYLVRHYKFPEYVGDLDNSANDEYENTSTTRAIYRDKTCHLTSNVGRVLAGLVWYEMVTGNSAVENRYERSTLSASDMAKLKEAAHYACLNYMTYDPEAIFSEDEAEAVAATAMRVKNGAKAIVSFIHDDGATGTVEYLAPELEKYNLNATMALWGNRLTNSTIGTWRPLIEAANGRLNIASHSYSHEYLGESDNAESGTLKDGTSYNYPAGHMTTEIANERARINGYFPNERVLTFIKPGTSYPEGKAQVSSAAKAMIEEHYIAMRNTGGGVETIPPANYYSVKSYMAEQADEPSKWIGYLEDAYDDEGMIVYLFHSINATAGSWNLSTVQSDVSVLLEEIGDYVADNRVWSAKFDEAMQYCREYSAITKVEALNIPTQNKMTVEVRDSISKIDHDITTGKYAGRDMYDYPITVKTQIPYNWDYVKVTQSYDNRIEIVKTFTENGIRYAYVNVVPDQAAAILKEATVADYIGSISFGGSAISGFDPAKFYYKVTLPGGTASAPAVTCNKSGAVITNATLKNGEGSAFIEFNGLKYEVHFSVN